MDVNSLFEDELTRRGVAFSPADPARGYVLQIGETKVTVSLDNLTREVNSDGDLGRIKRFVDIIEQVQIGDSRAIAKSELYWCLEPNDHADPPAFRRPVSDKLDKVLGAMPRNAGTITWVDAPMLEASGIAVEDAARLAEENLAKILRDAKVSVSMVQDVRLGMLATHFPFKSSLLLATNLKEEVAEKIGWPILAVAPVRDFLYLWDAKHQDFAGRVGRVVVDEFRKSAYPLSTEVFMIDDAGIEAIGAFPVD